MGSSWQAVRATRAEREQSRLLKKAELAVAIEVTSRHAETKAKGDLEQTLKRERVDSCFHRITLAHRELSGNLGCEVLEAVAHIAGSHGDYHEPGLQS